MRGNATVTLPEPLTHELQFRWDLSPTGLSATVSETQWTSGTAPVWGPSVRLPEPASRGAAEELLFTGRRIDGCGAESAAAGR